MVVRALDVVPLLHPFPRKSWVLPFPVTMVRCLLLVVRCCVAWCLQLVVDVTVRVAQSCMEAELPAPVIATDAACLVEIASSVVAPAASAAAIACCARWAVIAASCASICSVDALLAAASTAACCRWISLFALLSSWAWSSYSVQGSVVCPVRCSVRSRACFPLPSMRRSRRSKISGVRGIRSLPLLPLELDAADADPPLSILELRASLPRSHDSIPCCQRGASLLCCSIVLLLSGAFPTRSLRGIVGGCGVPNRR